MNNSPTMTHDKTTTSLPLEIKEQILNAARALPEGDRKRQFIQAVSKRCNTLVRNNQNLLSYAMIGAIIGAVKVQKAQQINWTTA